jgi:hypothetical protein
MGRARAALLCRGEIARWRNGMSERARLLLKNSKRRACALTPPLAAALRQEPPRRSVRLSSANVGSSPPRPPRSQSEVWSEHCPVGARPRSYQQRLWPWPVETQACGQGQCSFGACRRRARVGENVRRRDRRVSADILLPTAGSPDA